MGARSGLGIDEEKGLWDRVAHSARECSPHLSKGVGKYKVDMGLGKGITFINLREEGRCRG